MPKVVYEVKTTYDQPREFFEMVVTGDTCYFDNEEEYKKFISRHVAHDYLDNAVILASYETVASTTEIPDEEFFFMRFSF